MFSKIRQWLIDTYNGLYVIVLKPHMPTYVTVFAVVIAALFGVLWGYVLAPVTFYDSAPYQMNEGYRDEWLKMVAGAYSAGFYDETNTLLLLNQVEAPAANVERLINDTTENSVQAGLRQLLPLAQQATGLSAPRANSNIQDVLGIILFIILVIVAALIISPIWRLLIKPNIVDQLYEKLRPKTKEEVEEKKRQQADLALIRQKKLQEEQMRKDSVTAAATNPYGAPIMQKLSIYTKGRAFDDSFAIEDADDMFLGECGATIAKTIGDSNELAAVEIWLFDKEDFVRTFNKLLVAEHLYNDPMQRADLESRVDNPATDIIVATPGAVLTLETDAILMQAKVLEVGYGNNGILPPNSFLEGLKLQVEAWQKAGGSAAPAAATVPVAAVPAAYTPPPATYTPDPVTFDPPPMPPASMPAPPPMAPPPPMPPARQQDDDPFGGTGDFTPIGS